MRFYISLPPSLHKQWSIAAAQQSKQVLCEKPLAMDAAEASEIDQVCREQGVRWLDATAWLHHERTAAFRGWLDEGRFGKIGHVSASVSFYRPFQSDDHRLAAVARRRLPVGPGLVLCGTDSFCGWWLARKEYSRRPWTKAMCRSG